MNIVIIEPYYTGSHADWARGLQKFSRHQVKILSLKGQFWKWRMHGGAVTLAGRYMQQDEDPDLILATDMLDLATFLALTRERTAHIPTAVYFHEDQLVYPWSPTDRDVRYKRDRHYGFINYTSALAADAVFFNSEYHYQAWFDELPRFLKHFPDHQGLCNVESIAGKSSVLPLGLYLERFQQAESVKNDLPLILWNHRWEFDKNPDDFFNALFVLQERGVEFQLAILGENFSVAPEIFAQARERLGEKIVRFGYAASRAEYAEWLHRADILPVTSVHDFFGASVMEAVYCGCWPILPNRLSYPELVPGDLHGEVLYNSQDELVEKLEYALLHIDEIRSRNVRYMAAPYDWTRIIGQYDRTLESLVSNNQFADSQS